MIGKLRKCLFSSEVFLAVPFVIVKIPNFLYSLLRKIPNSLFCDICASIYLRKNEAQSSPKVLISAYPALPIYSHFHMAFFWVLGDLMGPTLKVDSLLKLPYGCGEQNMVNFAPSIYIMKYLSSVEQLSESIENKAKNIMRTGNELDM